MSIAIPAVRIARPRRYEPIHFMFVIAVTWMVLGLAFEYVESNWAIGLTFADLKCIPGTMFLIDKHSSAPLVRGHAYAFAAGHVPPIPDRALLVKYAAGLPGDHVVVNEHGVYINGVHWGDLNPITLQHTHHTIADVRADYIVPTGKVAMLGTLPRSYDSRYWGLVDMRQMVGSAQRLW
jgi:conjugal transfer pilin signal peptidase TrbI